MARLTDQEIAQLAWDAGFRGDMLNTAVAVALAESSGRTDAIGDVALETGKWGPSVGLWQIRSLNPGHGTAREQAQRDETANLDPATNAANAYAISGNGTSFRQWSTYTNGDYQRYLDRARAASGLVTGNPVQPVHQAEPAPVPTPAPTSAARGNGQSFHAAGGTLGPLARTLHTAAADLNTVRGNLTASTLPGDAFGQIPQSRQAAQSHAATLSGLAGTLGEAAEEIDRTGGNVTTARENYLRQDRHHAEQYRQIILRLFTGTNVR
ncbi:transglycosylase SLT domain-containing protein [Crossiella sp. SN42]|uniref:transglycosylase SLT domain-containing protein n=1 Tax=Crossiella sp. SN42 TaxID=2944808 RepID=UPI00207D509D|nr:transglycosylase SLT domain-containing protein [Crossiella sp. SN42]MCO1576250.1 transglycosylase SLT domain-containing protein [Crossiella sp. SN42]